MMVILALHVSPDEYALLCAITMSTTLAAADDDLDYARLQALERKGLTTTRYEADDTAVWIVGELSQAGKRMMRGERA